MNLSTIPRNLGEYDFRVSRLYVALGQPPREHNFVAPPFGQCGDYLSVIVKLQLKLIIFS